jgi:hypothetical protein
MLHFCADAQFVRRSTVIAAVGRDHNRVGQPRDNVNETAQPLTGPPYSRQRRELGHFCGVFVDVTRQKIAAHPHHDPRNIRKSPLMLQQIDKSARQLGDSPLAYRQVEIVQPVDRVAVHALLNVPIGQHHDRSRTMLAACLSRPGRLFPANVAQANYGIGADLFGLYLGQGGLISRTVKVALCSHASDFSVGADSLDVCNVAIDAFG